MSDLYRHSGFVEGPNDSNTYTAGIDMLTTDFRGQPDWHLHAIEFHDKHKSEAARRRDEVFAMLKAAGKVI